jgi:RNA polymerase sigma-70 factor (ECF subfamily)
MRLPEGRSLPAREIARDASAVSADDTWLRRFHAGDRRVLEDCYRQHFATVERAIGTLLGAADRETAIHELWTRIIDGAPLRRSFQGGAFAAWIGVVARHHAIDMRRRITREVVHRGAGSHAGQAEPSHTWEEAAQAHLVVERFRRELLPPEWAGVFELRFLQQLPQREAAARLSLRRTTLAYRELRIRRLLRRFLLDDEGPGLGAPLSTERDLP